MRRDPTNRNKCLRLAFLTLSGYGALKRRGDLGSSTRIARDYSAAIRLREHAVLVGSFGSVPFQSTHRQSNSVRQLCETSG
jgi:hypothetical protein